MIVYLGLPRCASTWMFSHIDEVNIKETHYLYTSPDDPVEYTLNNQFDFSTNNWSMDSQIAKMIDPYVEKYILTIRNPVDLAVSYKTLFKLPQTLDQFINTLIVNKLLCYGDIIERWYNLVDPNKILIYNYNDLLLDNKQFISRLTNDLSVPMIKSVSNVKINVSANKVYELVSGAHLEVLDKQISKFEQITNLPLNYTINNKL
jgi:hypothetical protein